MKVVFMGAPAFAVPTLNALAQTGADIVAVYTKAPKRAGRRGLELTRTAVHVAAEARGLRVETPLSLRDPGAQQSLRELRADVAVVAAYGLLLPAEALAAPRLGCFNLHGSLLPRWRGAAPVQRAIMAGDAETGVSIMRMEVGLDTGPIAGELRTVIAPQETSGELSERLAQLAAETIRAHFVALVEERLAFAPQSAAGVEYARKIDKSEAPVDWSADGVRLRNHIHALSPFPGATAALPGGERLKILRAEVAQGEGPPGVVLGGDLTVACGRGAVRLLRVQRPGRNAISGDELMRSGVLRVGDRLS